MKFDRIFYFLFFVLFSSSICHAQDPQFSQFYNAPLYLNPAYAGTGNNTRAVLNYRNQWPGLTKPVAYVTMAASFDHNIESINSGVGFLLLRDRQGKGNLSTTEISGIYSYQFDISRKWSFRPGVQAGMVIRSIDYSKLVFGDQITADGETGDLTNDQIVGVGNNKIYPDISAGGVLFSNNAWFGLSTHHLNRPNQAFAEPRLPLPIKYSFQTGIRLPVGKQSVKKGYSEVSKERSIVPTLLYKSQGKFDQLDVGMYFINEPVMVGMWYRGLPIKSYAGYANNESLVFMAGLNYQRLSFCYSFDLTLSALSVNNTRGAHEISLIYEWNIPYKNKRATRPLPCPSFYKNKSINLDKMEK